MAKEDYINERVIDIAKYMVKNNSTMRQAAKVHGVGRSTVFRDIHNRLQKLNEDLYFEVLKVIEKNIEERHIRGGDSTKRKYKNSI